MFPLLDIVVKPWLLTVGQGFSWENARVVEISNPRKSVIFFIIMRFVSKTNNKVVLDIMELLH
jgi:hypothetical protein